MEELIKLIEETETYFENVKNVTFNKYRRYYSTIYTMIEDVSSLLIFIKQNMHSMDIEDAKSKVRSAQNVIRRYVKSLGIIVQDKVDETLMKLDTGEIDLTDIINNLNDASLGELPKNIGIYTNFEKGTRL